MPYAGACGKTMPIPVALVRWSLRFWDAHAIFCHVLLPKQPGFLAWEAHLSAALSAQQRRMSSAYAGGQLSGTSGRRPPCTTLNITCAASKH